MDQDELLLALGELVSKEISVGELLGRIVDVMVELVHADRGTLYVLDRANDELVSIAAHLPEMEELRVPLSQGVAGHVARTGETVNLPSADGDDRFWKDVDEQTGYTTRSMLAVPLDDVDGQRLGVVQLLNRHDGPFTDQDEARVRELTRQAAALLEQTTFRTSTEYLDDEKNPFREHAVDTDQTLALGHRFNRIIGEGPEMREVFDKVRRVASTDATVLLLGESGTGKSLVARAVHHNSERRAGPFVHVDCTTLPESLIENELFGHERGAYTGADQAKEGRVAAADGGTLFLDEIGDLPPSMQGKLLTLLQEHSFMPVGSNERREVDIRVVAATNRDLDALVDDGHFREDLYYRLRVVQVDMPPLRERSRADLVRLIHHFVGRAAKKHGRPIEGISKQAWAMLLSYDWPGNVRELQNCIESAVIFADAAITPSTLSIPRPETTRKIRALGTLKRVLRPDSTLDDVEIFADEPTLDQLEARYIAWLLEKHDDNRSQCARVMGIGRNTLLRKIKAYDL
jgi:Nif-specific regulatory protein